MPLNWLNLKVIFPVSLLLLLLDWSELAMTLQMTIIKDHFFLPFHKMVWFCQPFLLFPNPIESPNRIESTLISFHNVEAPFHRLHQTPEHARLVRSNLITWNNYCTYFQRIFLEEEWGKNVGAKGLIFGGSNSSRFQFKRAEWLYELFCCSSLALWLWCRSERSMRPCKWLYISFSLLLFFWWQ